MWGKKIQEGQGLQNRIIRGQSGWRALFWKIYTPAMNLIKIIKKNNTVTSSLFHVSININLTYSSMLKVQIYGARS